MAVELRPPAVAAPPAATEERFRGKPRNPVGVMLLFITLVYPLVWYYRINDECRRYLRDNSITPGLSVLALMIGPPLAAIPILVAWLAFDGLRWWWWVAVGVLALIPLLVPAISIYRTGERIRRVQVMAGVEESVSGSGGLMLLPIFPAYYQAALNDVWGKAPSLFGVGLGKGLFVTLRHLLSRSVTQQYPHEKPDLPARTRGVIALKPENCTVCWKCSRECPDWCIYIESHKETHQPASGGRARSVKVLDRFAIDYALCMYCGICVEVCPFDALFWSPEFEYATYDIVELTHEKEKLDAWTYTVLPPPELEEGAEPVEEAPAPEAVSEAPTSAAPVARPGAEEETQPAQPQAAAQPAVAPPAEQAQQRPEEQTQPAPAEEATGTPERGEEPMHVDPDQQTYEDVLEEQLSKGVDRRVAEGRAKAAAIRAARAKMREGGA